MARSHHLLSELRRQLARLDDDGFAALASVGLLRRARKDLASQAPTIDAQDDAVIVKVSGHEVILDARGPAQARCTCSSKTTCQHVLAACLHLQSLPELARELPPHAASGANDRASLEAELLAFDMAALVKYGGKRTVRDAVAAVESDAPASIAFDGTIVVRLAASGVEFRYAGGGLDGLISDFRGRSAKKLAMQAVLSFQRAHGVEHALPGEKQKDDLTDALPESLRALRLALLEKVERLLRDCIDVGLAHVSDSLIERLSALATLAEGAKLHRIALALTRLSDHVDLILERHARADSEALFAELARTYALACALRNPLAWSRVELVGEARSSYREIDTLALYCAGAYPWQTASGYWGLTLLLWSAAEGRWFTYSDSRPVGTPGFAPTEAYRMSGPWRGCASPAAIMGRHLTLHKARTNRFGRLSAASETIAETTASNAPPDFAGCAYRTWSALRSRSAEGIDNLGLAERNPLADYVVLYPRRFLAREFEAKTQTLVWPVEDESGEFLLLRLEYSNLSAPAVERLDSMVPPAGVGVLAQVVQSGRVPIARPLSFLGSDDRAVDNVFLDAPPRTSRAQTLFGKLRASLSAQSSVRADAAPETIDATDRMLIELNDLLLKIAERGMTAHAAYAGQLASVLRKLHDGGLTSFDPESTTDTEAVLRMRYLSELAHDCLSRV